MNPSGAEVQSRFLWGDQPVVTVGVICLQKKRGDVCRQCETSQKVYATGGHRRLHGLPVINRTASVPDRSLPSPGPQVQSAESERSWR